eukprot:m.149094 g.149094  ORF g.149094 m.149094 type:complete len:140 (-) comp24418_c0_seq3:30-449(-)
MCYCALHGCTFILDLISYEKELYNQTINVVWQDEPLDFPFRRFSHFLKLFSISKWLPHYHWIFFQDMDTLMLNNTQSVETFLAAAEAEGAHLIVTDSPVYGISAGSYVIRNSPEGRELLKVRNISVCFCLFVFVFFLVF